jgi:hypothetical protein
MGKLDQKDSATMQESAPRELMGKATFYLQAN